MPQGLKDWQVEYKGMPIGTLGDLQGFDDLMDFGLVGSDRIDIDMSAVGALEIACTLNGVSFKKLMRLLGVKEQWLEYAHEWSAKCRDLRRKLKDRGKI